MQLEQFIVTETNNNYECNVNIIAAMSMDRRELVCRGGIHNTAGKSGAEVNVDCCIKGTLYEI